MTGDGKTQGMPTLEEVVVGTQSRTPKRLTLKERYRVVVVNDLGPTVFCV